MQQSTTQKLQQGLQKVTRFVIIPVNFELFKLRKFIQS